MKTGAKKTGAEMRAILLALVLAGALPGEAQAQTLRQEWEWCRGRDPDHLIRGCSAIIRSGQEAPDNLARAFFNRGRAWTDRGRYDLAVQDLDHAIKLDPNYPDAFNDRALAYAGLGKYDQAIEDFDQAIRLDPN
jgi:tetratricopeptide (TPR) repeat protein